MSGSTVNFYTDGCGRSISNLSVGQSMGIIVINCFMIVLAFLAIPAFMHVYPEKFGQYNVDDNRFGDHFPQHLSE